MTMTRKPRNFNLEDVEYILGNAISRNESRFDSANGIVFSVDDMNPDIEEYFNSYGIEIHHLQYDIYYTETIMSVSEFAQMDHVVEYQQVA